MLYKSRRLGEWERLHAKLHQTVNGHGLITVALRLNQRLVKDRISVAFKKLIKIHPLLSCVLSLNIEKIKYQKDFVDHLPIQFRENANMDDWYFIFDQEQNTALNLEQSLWRVSFLFQKNKTDILFSISHAICDGVAINALFNDFFSYYFKNEKECVANKRFPPPLEKAVSVSGLKDLSLLDSVFPYAEKALCSNRSSCSEMLFFDKNELASIKQFCRNHSISLNAWLAAHLLLSMQALTQTNVLPIENRFFNADQSINKPMVSFDHLSLLTGINLRRYAKKKNALTGLGCYASVIATEHKVNGDSLSLAKQYQKTLKEKIRHRQWLSPTLSKNKVAEITTLLADEKRDRFLFSAGITKLGHIKKPEGVDIEFVYGNTSRMAADFALLLAVIECPKGLCLTFSYTAPMLNPEEVKQLTLGFKKKLTAICLSEQLLIA